MSERVYKLLNGSELLVSEEVMGVRQTPDSMPITVDGDYVIDDVLKLVDMGNEAARELEYAKKQVIFWNDEAVRLQKELKAERKRAESVRKAMQDVLYYLQRDSYIPAQDILEQYLAMGQEGEGNHEQTGTVE